MKLTVSHAANMSKQMIVHDVIIPLPNMQ